MLREQKTSKMGCPCEGTQEAESNKGARSMAILEPARENHVKLLEEILNRNNLNEAYKRVKSKKGAAGVDAMTVDEMLGWLKENKEELLESLRNGKYKPKPVKRVEIPKPDGGKRKLGIPTVLDRLIQQAIAQVLQPIFEKTFSENSYGFRSGRNAQQAITKAKGYYEQRYTKIVDLDLAQYFDTVNHDILINVLREEIKDERVISLIRPHGKVIKRFKEKVKKITARNRGKTISAIILELKKYTTGWLNYYAIGDMRTKMQEINKWIRRRLRMYIWKQWKKISARFGNLKRLGLDKEKAWEYANTRLGYWRVAGSVNLSKTLTDKYLESLGYMNIAKKYEVFHLR